MTQSCWSQEISLNWFAEYEGWSFIPLNSSEYEINQIPYNNYSFNEFDVFWIDEGYNIVSLNSSFNFTANEYGDYVFYLCEQNDTANSLVSIIDSIQISVPQQIQSCETLRIICQFILLLHKIHVMV